MTLSQQLTAARALLGWDLAKLSAASGVSVIDIERLETKAGTIPPNTPELGPIFLAFEKAGVVLIDEGPVDGGAGVRFRTRRSAKVYTDEADTVQYKEYLVNDAPPGAGG